MKFESKLCPVNIFTTRYCGLHQPTHVIIKLVIFFFVDIHWLDSDGGRVCEKFRLTKTHSP